MTEMYIRRWWGQTVGNSDDSNLLIDFFSSKKETRIHLSEIIDELKLEYIIKSKDQRKGSCSFNIGPREYKFNMSINVIIDLCALSVESLHRGKIDLNLLDMSPNFYTNVIRLKVDKDSVILLKSGLDDFVTNYTDYTLYKSLPRVEFDRLVRDCGEISREIAECYNIECGKVGYSTKEQAYLLISLHACSSKDINNEKWKKGFLGCLKPFKGQVYFENFYEIMECLKLLSSDFVDIVVPRRLVDDINSIIYLGRRWINSSEVQNSNLMDEQYRDVMCWINMLEDCLFHLLHGDIAKAFAPYEKYRENYGKLRSATTSNLS